jgi:hypothetical protein
LQVKNPYEVARTTIKNVCCSDVFPNQAQCVCLVMHVWQNFNKASGASLLSC